MPIDFSEDAPKAGKGDPKRVIQQARLMMKLELEIAALEKRAKEKKQEHEKIATETLPALMKAEGLTSLGLNGGYSLVLDEFFRANIPAESTIEKANDEDRDALLERREQGFDWLRRNQGADLIKNEIKIGLPRGMEKVAKLVLKAIADIRVKNPKTKKEEAPAMEVERKVFVHQGALGSFLKEKVESGVEVPYETFSIHTGQEAKIKAPKGQKKGK